MQRRGGVHDRHARMLAHDSLARVLELVGKIHAGGYSVTLHWAKVGADAFISHKVLLGDIAELSMMLVEVRVRELLLKRTLPVSEAATTASLLPGAAWKLGRVRRAMCPV